MGKVIVKKQDNEGATFKKDVFIKDLVLVNKQSPASKLFKEFSKNRNHAECTLTAFIEWLQKKK